MGNDATFRFFHVDGQMIAAEDYLAFRPEAGLRVKALISAGRLIIGPRYVLQGAFLTTGESHVRNIVFGLKGAGALGAPMMVRT
jgi:alpha-mannosidase